MNAQGRGGASRTDDELREAIDDHCRLFELDAAAKRRIAAAAASMSRSAMQQAADNFRNFFSMMEAS